MGKKACQQRAETQTNRRDFDAMFREPEPEEIPRCAASMGCLCAGHARGNPASAPCDTSEGPPAPKMIELLDEIIAMATDLGRARAEFARGNVTRALRKRVSAAHEALAHARTRFLTRFS